MLGANITLLYFKEVIRTTKVQWKKTVSVALENIANFCDLSVFVLNAVMILIEA